MAWVNIPNNPHWQYNTAPPDPGASSPQRALWLKQTAGIRTNTDGDKVYTMVRRVGDTSDNSLGEISKSFWDARGSEDDDVSFRTLWETIGDAETITWPCDQGGGNVGTFNAVIDWGDGTADSTITSEDDPDLAHTYATAGEYTIRITGSFPTLSFGTGSGDSKLRIKKVLQMGQVGWKNLKRGFKGCTNLTDFTVGACTTDFAGNRMLEMFNNCTSLVNINLASEFDTSGVTSFSTMFRHCDSLVSVDVSTMDTSDATTLNSMFRDCDNMTDIPGIQNFDLGSLNTVNAFTDRFFDSPGKMTTATYDAMLIAFEAQAPFDIDEVSFGASQFTSGGAAEAARTSLVNTYGWIISDGGSA